MKSQFLATGIEVFYIKPIMNLEWYRIFLHTAKLGNLTRAAQELLITQPSVSYAIKQLEEGLGVKLFDRLSKGVSLTAEGKALLEYVEQSLALLDSGERQIAALKNLVNGELRIGASGPIIKHLLLSPLDKLRAMYPDIRIRLSQGKTADITSRLTDGQIDLGFVHLPLTDANLHIEELALIKDCFVVGPAYRKLAEQPISTAELTSIPLLLHTFESSTRQFIERWFSAQGFTVEVDIELNSSDMLIELAQHGYGAAFVTRSFVQKELSSGKLFELHTTEPIPVRGIGVATRRSASLSIVANYFMELLAAETNTSKPT